MPAGLSLMKSILSPLAKGVLIPFGLSAGTSAADATIHKKFYGSGCPSNFAYNGINNFK